MQIYERDDTGLQYFWLFLHQAASMFEPISQYENNCSRYFNFADRNADGRSSWVPRSLMSSTPVDRTVSVSQAPVVYIRNSVDLSPLEATKPKRTLPFGDRDHFNLVAKVHSDLKKLAEKLPL